MIPRMAIFVALLTILCACATVPMADPQQEALGKRFDPPPSGRGALYVYRESIFGAAVLIGVSLGQRQLGSLASDTWFRVDVEPGRHELRCSTIENSAATAVQVGPGEIRFVEVAARFGFGTARCDIFEVRSDKGKIAVQTGRRAAPM